MGAASQLGVLGRERAVGALNERAERDWVLALAGEITSGQLAWPRPRTQEQETRR